LLLRSRVRSCKTSTARISYTGSRALVIVISHFILVRHLSKLGGSDVVDLEDSSHVVEYRAILIICSHVSGDTVDLPMHTLYDSIHGSQVIEELRRLTMLMSPWRRISCVTEIIT
jgi:hypothetical protein